MRVRTLFLKTMTPIASSTGATRRDVEAEDLDNQGGADIGAEHDCQSGNQPD